MPDHRASHRRGPDVRRTIEQTTRRTVKRRIGHNVQLAFQYRRDIMRGGSPSEILQLLEREASGNDNSEDTLDLDLETEGIAASDSEVLLADEDSMEDSDADGWNTMATAEPDEGLGWRVDLHDRIAIVVTQGQAVFRIPDWAMTIGDGDLDLRWETYRRIADWLNREKQSFLAQPSFLNLAQGTIDLRSPIPVLQEGLHRLLSLPCDITSFSKHCRHGVLVWPSRTMPMEDLWSKEAKLAWCACAAVQRQRNCGYATKTSPLGDPSIQPLRAASERKILKRKADSGFSLGPIDFVQLVCVLTDCTWRDVLSRYGDLIFPRG